jgi:hypothetical protein
MTCAVSLRASQGTDQGVPPIGEPVRDTTLPACTTRGIGNTIGRKNPSGQDGRSIGSAWSVPSADVARYGDPCEERPIEQSIIRRNGSDTVHIRRLGDTMALPVDRPIADDEPGHAMEETGIRAYR